MYVFHDSIFFYIGKINRVKIFVIKKYLLNL